MPEETGTLLIRWLRETECRLNVLDELIGKRFDISAAGLLDLVRAERSRLPLSGDLAENGAILNAFLTRVLEDRP
jgi:hypothetical protein